MLFFFVLIIAEQRVLCANIVKTLIPESPETKHENKFKPVEISVAESLYSKNIISLNFFHTTNGVRK